MFKWYENYKGGINNLAVVKSFNVTTTSIKGMDIAIKNHNRKLKKLGINIK
ncbi:TPA: hypothetical protein PTV74_003315 [Clostridium botulinum]|uniref:hypothetical protein n=1 Tax=Clostridium botulinum TaxID=1491 RepID=UPI0004B5DA8E|nr:hypothetical protein [Clostridium botulinum]APH21046.1 hypothetical protein NPD1_4352 [Clostridium botulinum]APQ71111.1 hypothetical protein RSJ8_4309 [Clostridium botulinum]HDK7195008.1 hypothetical protein [Clostridium botulinum]HDK7206470.1 hypothetical protein [Clostridium botulinum]HDK7210205.1 hypothetical protein [Clostridium botulinum]